MFRVTRKPSHPPRMDLTTVRETLAYMHGDAARVPGLEKLAQALAVAMTEADEARRTAARPIDLDGYRPRPYAARFIAARR